MMWSQGDSSSRHRYPNLQEEDGHEEEERVYTVPYEGLHILEILGLEAYDKVRDVEAYIKAIRKFSIAPHIRYPPPS
jgi:hypothetical protein